MPRFKLTIEYDGSNFAGWQRQPDNVETIQQYIEEAIEKFAGKFCEVFAAGRTDAGVHATGQVVHCDIDKNVSDYNVLCGINFYLLPVTEKIIVTKAERVSDDFHARFSATGRAYLYRILNRHARPVLENNRVWHIGGKPLDSYAMHQAAQILVGRHDFSSFINTDCQAPSKVKNVDRLDVIRVGDELKIYVEARSFLHNQVRNMVGTLAMIGKGKWDQAKLQSILEAKDRRAAGQTAPACGLYLTEVTY